MALVVSWLIPAKLGLVIMNTFDTIAKMIHEICWNTKTSEVD